MIDNVKVYIFTITGLMVRKIEYQNPQDKNLFTGYDTDPYTGKINYYFVWDGKNDNGSYVRNGIYMVKVEVIKKDGNKSIITKLVALIK